MSKFRMPSWITLGVLATVGVLISAACGGGAPASTDVEISEFSLTVTPVSVTEGGVEFTVTNAGAFPHQFVVIRTNLAPDALPTTAEGGVDESQVDVVGRIDTFDPGTTRLVKLDMPKANYVLICNIISAPADGDVISHYANGMATRFTVFQNY